MKEKFLDPCLEAPQVKIKFQDGWGTNAMVLKEDPPAWLKEVKIQVLRKIGSLNKAASKTKVKEVADYFTQSGRFMILEEEIREVYGIMHEKAGHWVKIGHVMIQQRYWDLFNKDYDCVLIPMSEHSDPVVTFYKEGEPVAVFMGIKGTYSQFKEVAKFLDDKLEVSK